MSRPGLCALVASLVLGASAASATPAAPRAVELATNRVVDEAFELTLRPVGTYHVGSAAKAEIVLVARKGYKVNDKYPTKFRFDPSSQVKLDDDVVQKDAFRIEGNRGIMTLKFTPHSAGKKKVLGEFKFSVCTNDRCLVEKRDLALTLTVD